MGGGASSMGMEDMIVATCVIGRAISAVSFPGMYRAQDFHSKKAPKLKAMQNFTFYMPGSGSVDQEGNFGQDEGDEFPDPSQYAHFFQITVDKEIIYLEDPAFINSDGWTALHTCCMSFNTVSAGTRLIDEFLRLGTNLDVKTSNGPGSFNKGWTALHMACAYGVEPLVLKLIQSGANPNTTNCYGYTPLLEACHRGFVNVVAMLLSNRADLNYIPPEQLSLRSPFVNAPAQSALGESARCGFPMIVQKLLDNGAERNIPNALGWTPLHEACFYNRIETVKTLMLGGSDATLRTKSGALPFHLSGLAVVRTMLKEMGGPEAVPEKGDDIDMIEVLRELTLPDVDLDETDDGDYVLSESAPAITRDESKEEKGTTLSSDTSSTSRPSPKSRSQFPSSTEESSSNSNKLLHSGDILGDLPALTTGSSTGTKYHSPTGQALGAALDQAEESFDFGGKPVNRDLSAMLAKVKNPRKRRERKNKSSGRALNSDRGESSAAAVTDMPKEFLCELSQKPMSDPVESVYGNVFEKTVIQGWMKQSGHICPLTGGPLVESDLRPLEDLRLQITKWLLQKSMDQSQSQSTLSLSQSSKGAVGREDSPPSRAPAKTGTGKLQEAAAFTGDSHSSSKAAGPAADDDLYDF